MSRTETSSRSDLDSYLFVAYAYARFADTMTIDSPSLTGQDGTTTFDITVSGISSRSGSGGGQSLLWVSSSLSDPYYVLYETNIQLNGERTFTTDPIDFTYGVPFSFYVSMGARSLLSGVDPGFSSIDMRHTLTLSDIDVYDQDNNPITGYSMQTASGATYPFAEVPIPEPATLLLLGIGLLGLAGVRRKQGPAAQR